MNNSAECLDLSVAELALVKQILEQLPDGVTVWVFGSRAIGKAKQYSDLDIALEKEDGLAFDTRLLVQLSEDFEESKLPYKVDIIDYNAATGIFKQNIEAQMIKVNLNEKEGESNRT